MKTKVTSSFSLLFRKKKKLMNSRCNDQKKKKTKKKELEMTVEKSTATCFYHYL
jgi:hypothetical protein